MILIKENTLERIKNWEDDSIHILTDFDRTITVGNSDSSWGILSKSNLLPKEYALERQKLYDYYRPIEIDETMEYNKKRELMTEWWNKHINLLVKYKLSEEVVNKAVNDLNVMSLRDGVKEFLMNMQDRNIPVIIISAGVGNFIEQILIKNDCNYKNIYIVSNFIRFENGIAVGISDNIIHSLNKNEVGFPFELKKIIKNRPNIILLGDSISDVKMAKEEIRENALKIGFLDEKIEENMQYFEKQFDIVCTNNTDYNELTQKVRILKK